MSFSAPRFLTYVEYCDVFGTEIEETLFNRMEYKAMCYINRITRNRVANEDPLRESVKHLTAEIIHYMASVAMTGADSLGIASSSNDGVSVAYNGADTVVREEERRFGKLALDFLANEVTADGVPLLKHDLPMAVRPF